MYIKPICLDFPALYCSQSIAVSTLYLDVCMINLLIAILHVSLLIVVLSLVATGAWKFKLSEGTCRDDTDVWEENSTVN